MKKIRLIPTGNWLKHISLLTQLAPYLARELSETHERQDSRRSQGGPAWQGEKRSRSCVAASIFGQGRRQVGLLLFTLFFFPTLHCANVCNPGLLSLGVGIFDVLRPNERMMQVQAEYKWSASWYGVQPISSLMFTQKGSTYFCFGACYDLYLTPQLVLEPSFAPGIYIKGKGKELGFPLEFRSSIALAAQFRGCHRLGLQFYHISNAKLGFKNPGEESLVLFYSIPIW